MPFRDDKRIWIFICLQILVISGDKSLLFMLQVNLTEIKSSKAIENTLLRH